jgi:hypothetical protein
MISLGLPAGRWGILVKGPGTRTRMKVWSFGGGSVMLILFWQNYALFCDTWNNVFLFKWRFNVKMHRPTRDWGY